MPTYIALMKWTDQGIRAIKESGQRFDAARQMIEQAGGTLRDFYMVMGEYDLLGIIEAPDDETYARIALSAASQGNLHTTTLKAFTQEEYRRIVDSLP